AGFIRFDTEQIWTTTVATQDSSLRFGTTLNGTATERVRINSDGNVGIGKTDPSVKLHVAPASGTYSILAGGTAPTAYRIGNVDDPSAVDDAVTKYYVDNLFSGFGSYLPLAGGTMAGAINMGNNNISNVNTLTVTKLTATTIDPLYTIKGINYSTFAPSIAGGVKEECIGKIKISKLNAVKEYEAVIDFSAATEGSDLWVWRQVIDFNKDSVDVVITPYGEFARVYYVIDNNKLIFRSDKAVEISYRLIAKRYDWRDWPTRPEDQTTPGVVIK
ncbi:MAG: hypothetical protein Q8N57_02650, partial [bacterium]|nr:hypothetical protein [bacterium]